MFNAFATYCIFFLNSNLYIHIYIYIYTHICIHYQNKLLKIAFTSNAITELFLGIPELKCKFSCNKYLAQKLNIK